MKVVLEGSKKAAARYIGVAKGWLMSLRKQRIAEGLTRLERIKHIRNATVRLVSSKFLGEKAWVKLGFLLKVEGRAEDIGLPISNYLTISGTQAYEELPDEWYTQETIPIPEVDGILEGVDSGVTEDFENYSPDDIISESEGLTENELVARYTTVLVNNRLFLISRYSTYEAGNGVHGLSYQITNAIGEYDMELSSVSFELVGFTTPYYRYNITISFSEPKDGHLWNGLPTTRARFIPNIVGDGVGGALMEPTAPNQLIDGDTSAIDVPDLELELDVATYVDTFTVSGYPDGNKDVDRYIRLDSRSVREDEAPGYNRGFSIILLDVHVQSLSNVVEADSNASIVWETWDAVNDPPVNLPEEILNSGFNPDYEEPWNILELVTTTAPGGNNAAEMEASIPVEGGGGGGR